MKIGLLLPSITMSPSFKKRIFAPKKLFLQLADGLVKRGNKVYVYSIENLATKAQVVGGPAYLVRHKLPSVKFREGSKELNRKLTDQLTRSEFELSTTAQAYIHGQKVGLDIMHSYHDFMAHYISKLVKFSTVYSIHDPPYPESTMEAWRLKQFATDLYIPISKSHRNSFKGKIRFTDVIYHGVNLGSYSFHVHKKKYLAFMGRYLKEKGIVEAIETARSLQIPLHIAGDKAYRKLAFYNKKIKPLLSKGHVQEIGFMDGDAKNQFLGEARAFLFPIKWEEPFGMVLLEAMACGTPVIAFSRGSVPEIVKDGKTGYLVRPEAGVEGLIRATQKLLNLNNQDYSQMVHSCRTHVEENFTVERMVSGYEKVYKKVISHQSSDVR